MSPSGLPQTVLKETSGNTDFCYYVADRIALRYIRFIYACTDTPIYVNLLRDRRERVSNLNIHISPLLYIGRPGVPFVSRIIAMASIIMIVRYYNRDKIQLRSFRQMKPSIKGSPRSIRSNRHNRDTYFKDTTRNIFSPRNSQSLSSIPLRR